MIINILYYNYINMKSYSKDKKYKKYKKLLELANNTNAYYQNLISRQQIYIYNLNKTIETLKNKNDLDEENKKRIETLENIIKSLQKQTGGTYQDSFNTKDRIDYLYNQIASLIAKQKSLVGVEEVIKKIQDITFREFDEYSSNAEDILQRTYKSLQDIKKKLEVNTQSGGSYNSYIYYLMNDLLIILKILKNFSSENIKIIFEPDDIKQFIINNFCKNRDYLKILDQLYDIYQKILNIKSIKILIKINNLNDLENIINKLNIIKKYI